MTLFRTMTIGLAAVAAAILMAASAASAAPQILAVAPTTDAVPFKCVNGVCDVEVSAMCLQKERRFPDSQTAYRAHDEQSVQLVVTDAQGNRSKILAGDYVTIRSKRSFTAVTFKIDEDLFRSLGAESIALQVAGGAALVPDEVAGDWYPQTEDDIARATGPLRATAAGWLDVGDERTMTSRAINGVLNDLPRTGDVSAEDIAAAWDGVMAKTTALEPGARERAAEIFQRCRRLSADASAVGLRRCLERNHDSLMYRMNVEYWDAVGTGS